MSEMNKHDVNKILNEIDDETKRRLFPDHSKDYKRAVVFSYIDLYAREYCKEMYEFLEKELQKDESYLEVIDTFKTRCDNYLNDLRKNKL